MKQYLLMCNEATLHQLNALFKGIEAIEVQGMDIATSATHQVLVTPLVRPVTQMPMIAPTAPPTPDVAAEPVDA